MPTTKTIKPAGGGDYTTLQDWWDNWVLSDIGNDVEQHAECYTGSLGPLRTDGASTAELRIYAASGHELAATITDGLDQFETPHCIITNIASFTVDGLTIDGNGINGNVIDRFGGSYFELSNSILLPGAFGVTFIEYGTSTGDDDTLIFRNNLIPSGPYFWSSGNYDATMTFHNCTVDGSFYMDMSSDGEPHLTLLYENTYAGSYGGDSLGNAVSITLNNCMSEDGTADDFSGSNNQVDVDPSEVFTDSENDDYTLSESSPARDAGKTIGAVTTDILGTSRPQGESYDIGAYEAAVVAAGSAGLLLLGAG